MRVDQNKFTSPIIPDSKEFTENSNDAHTDDRGFYLSRSCESSHVPNEHSTPAAVLTW
jgi:deoxycytidine triphosphate deaminase